MKKVLYMLIASMMIISCTTTVVKLENGASVKVNVPEEAVIKLGDSVLVSFTHLNKYRIVSGVSGNKETVLFWNKNKSNDQVIYYSGVVTKIE